MKKLLLLIVLVGLAFGGWYLASPWLAMKSLADAAQAGDSAALETKIDFPALRASAADQITDAARQQREQGGIAGQLGGIVAEQIGRRVLDQALTPDRIGAVIATGALAQGLLPQRLQGQAIEWDVEREGFDNFRAVGTFEDGTQGPTLLFRREGAGWVLTGFELPGYGG